MNKILTNFIRSSLSSNNNTFYSRLSRSFSLDISHPQSKQTIFTPSPPPKIDNKFDGYIPMSQLKITHSPIFPKGKFISRVVSYHKVDIRFHVASVDWLSDETKKLLLEKHAEKINEDGFFVIKNYASRFMQFNLDSGLETIRNIIRELETSTKDPSPESTETTSQT